MIKCILTDFLKSKGITRYQLSKATGISQNALSLLSNNKNKAVSFELLNTICEYMNCELSNILIHVKDDSNKKR